MDSETVCQRRSRFAQKLNVQKHTPLASSRGCGLAGRPFRASCVV